MMSDACSLARVRPYVSNVDRPVFAITGLPEEVIAVLFAYYSRSRDDLRTNLARLLVDDALAMEVASTASMSRGSSAADKARAFHEKWVVGYGHSSVAEHAVVHLAVENVSIVASKVIEDLRLGSYTEKSTRYVVFDTGSFADLPSLPHALREAYRDACANLFRTYLELFPIVQRRIDETIPTDPEQTARSREAVVRAHTCDLLRGLLPASTRTNLGITANARALAVLVSKMMSWPLEEVRLLGQQMRDEARSVTPTLLRHAAENEHRMALHAHLHEVAASMGLTSPRASAGSGVRLVRSDEDALDRVVLGLLYESSGVDVQELAAVVSTLSYRDKQAIVEASLAKRGPHDPVPRAFEGTSVTVELTLDYGAYRDLQRHRMLTPATQVLGCGLGAQVPGEIERMGMGDRYRAALSRAEDTWARLSETAPWEAQYVVPLAYRVRTLWTLNLRELFHVVELRSGRQGHASYRRIAQQLHDVVTGRHPWLAGLMRVDMKEYEVARSG